MQIRFGPNGEFEDDPEGMPSGASLGSSVPSGDVSALESALAQAQAENQALRAANAEQEAVIKQLTERFAQVKAKLLLAAQAAQVKNSPKLTSTGAIIPDEVLEPDATFQGGQAQEAPQEEVPDKNAWRRMKLDDGGLDLGSP